MPKGTKRERAIVRKEGESDIAFLERKLAHAKEVEAAKATAKATRINQRIAAKQKQIAKLTTELSELEAERDKILGTEATVTASPADEV